ncbi:monocarboxylate transporter 12-like [Haliotis rubra]|uniref:monocarboxylate transporter 12-like n=1 Tax=Haliotis rubra TaxID=36100 RepID=UPI001EE5E5BB|nr:monocarboxylate transporter 12-like [Haliotis rubra]XP_046542427.1 monocarboxylate transporter 12-like [Haliotis rubra]XP_046542429.1 monocarboxylate transporter 12-like [Haliotis rubra]XP_046542430.1 monocarboxylate transporter 12-like [Haliotis rubra]XP_046542431.1 monocarboxylate transporter 12-like [Haliotis rubra]XP_046542432.1 monocarboxylate transporter 12-like [Haliotis rubra]XP_046542433.1 monocarboxylate transporter 12-like [Haliotis rubra]
MGKGRHQETTEDVQGNGKMETDAAASLPVPPDGGWGWMVVFSSFLIHVIADGIVYSFGVFFVEFLDYFKGGKGETSWVGSLVPAVTYTVGPIASALTNRYGCRAVTIAGAIIAAVGFILSLFAPNIYYLYFSFGIMSGVGFGLIYLPAIVSVANYFEKKRAFATGLAVCGSGFGTFILAPFTKWMIDEFGWKGTILIQAGLILNVIVCGALFRPLENKNKNQTDELLEKLEKEAKDILENEEKQSRKYDSKTEVNGKDESEALISPKPNPNVERLILPGREIEMNRIFNSNRELANPKGSTIDTPRIADLARSDGALHRVQNGRAKSASPVGSPDYLDPHRYHRQTSGGGTSGLLYRKDIFYSASLQNIPMYRSHHDVYIASITSIPEAVDDDNGKCCGVFKPSPEFRDAMKEMLSFSLLKNLVFLLFAISNFFTSIGFNMPFIYLPDRAIESGVETHNAAFLLSVIGIANTVGRVIFGWLSDRKGVNRLALYNSALTICGVATALSPFCGGSYPLLIVYAACFGVFIGVYVSLTSVVLVDLLGLDHLTNSFGLLLLFQGAATFIGPPMAGWMYDWTGSYDISFHVNGAMIAISGLMLFFIPCVQRYQYMRDGVSARDIEYGRHVKSETEIGEILETPTTT